MSIEAQKFTPNRDVVADWKNDVDAYNQRHWQKIFQNDEYKLYDRERKPVGFDAFRDASYEWINNPVQFMKNFGKHVRKIDYEFRGEKDAGGAKERLERVGALLGVIAAFTAFDYLTSKPFKKAFPEKKEDNGHLTKDEYRINGRNGAINTLIGVLNDKYATALGNMLGERLTGKRGFIHEVADKGADTIQTAYPNKLPHSMNDWVNGATLESYIRIISQVPIAGALFEQGATRLALWQERSPLHTATGKMIYMALGVFIRENRKAAHMSVGEYAAAAARMV